VVAACLRGDAGDSRLGDLSECYVRNHERVRRRLGNTALAIAASHVAANLYYLAASANVVVFVRAVDPALRAAESAAMPLVLLELREKTMTMLRVIAGKLMLPRLLLLGGALLVNSAVDVWTTWQQGETRLARMQLEKAAAVAARIEQYLASVQSQVSWTTFTRLPAASLDQRRVDSLMLLRQTPAITEVTQLDSAGKEHLKVSRLHIERTGSGDFANDSRFKEAMAKGVYFSPVYFRDAEPYLSLALAHGRDRTGVTIAEVNLKVLRDEMAAVTVGETGYAYAVDGKGHVIAHRDAGLVKQEVDLSGLPQVAAALAGQSLKEPAEGKAYEARGSGASVASAHAVVPNLGWHVFVDVPLAETRTPLWGALIRVAGILGLAVVAALLAGLIATRRVRPAFAAPA